MIVPINLQQWINQHRAALKPPVGNKVIFPERDFIVMVVGGPNNRNDYHVDPREELFYQLEGDIILNLMEDGQPRAVQICEGDMLLLPPGVPHMPVRPANTLGLVVEHQRQISELDGFQWYCEYCHYLLYEDFFHLTDIETECQAAFERFQKQAKHYSHCPHCQQYNELVRQQEEKADV